MHSEDRTHRSSGTRQIIKCFVLARKQKRHFEFFNDLNLFANAEDKQIKFALLLFFCNKFQWVPVK